VSMKGLPRHKEASRNCEGIEGVGGDRGCTSSAVGRPDAQGSRREQP